MSEIIVVTGGPCTGKTTSITDIEAAGFPVTHEEAAKLIKEGTPSLETDWWGFQRELTRRQMAAEAALRQHPLVFADRGVFDNVAYCLKKGVLVPDFLDNIPGPRYALAFLLEPLGFFKYDGVRKEDLAFTEAITPLLETAYRDRGVTVIRVPSMTQAERFAFMMKHAEPILERACVRK